MHRPFAMPPFGRLWPRGRLHEVREAYADTSSRIAYIERSSTCHDVILIIYDTEHERTHAVERYAAKYPRIQPL